MQHIRPLICRCFQRTGEEGLFVWFVAAANTVIGIFIIFHPLAVRTWYLIKLEIKKEQDQHCWVDENMIVGAFSFTSHILRLNTVCERFYFPFLFKCQNKMHLFPCCFQTCSVIKWLWNLKCLLQLSCSKLYWWRKCQFSKNSYCRICFSHRRESVSIFRDTWVQSPQHKVLFSTF